MTFSLICNKQLSIKPRKIYPTSTPEGRGSQLNRGIRLKFSDSLGLSNRRIEPPIPQKSHELSNLAVEGQH